MAIGDRYIDAVGGNDDTGDGLSWTTAWRKFNKLSSINFGEMGDGEHVRIYLRAGIYWLDESFSISVPSARTLEFIGIGPVVFKNPGRKRFTLHTSAAYGGNHTFVAFKNISFDTSEIERPLIAHLTGAFAVYVSNQGDSHLQFVNCFFKARIFRELYGDMSDVSAYKCGCVPGKTLTASDVASSLPVDHVLHDFSSGFYVSCSNSIETALRKDSGWMYPPEESLGAGGPEPCVFVAKNIGAGFVTLTSTDVESLHLVATDWIDDTTFPAGRPRLGVLINEITIDSGDAARVLSPVFQFATPSVFNKLSLITKEVAISEGHSAYIDSNVADNERTLEYRTSNTPFDPLDTTLLWVTYTRETSLTGSAVSFIQFRITLETRAT